MNRLFWLLCIGCFVAGALLAGVGGLAGFSQDLVGIGAGLQVASALAPLFYHSASFWGRVLPFVVCLMALFSTALPWPDGLAGPVLGLLLSAAALVLFKRRGLRAASWLPSVAVPVAASIGAAIVWMLAPDADTARRIVLAIDGSCLVLVALILIIWFVSLLRAAAIIFAVLASVLSVVFIAMDVVAPVDRFNGLMVLIVSGFIVACAVVASAVTFMLLRCIEKLEKSVSEPYVFMLPMVIASVVLMMWGDDGWLADLGSSGGDLLRLSVALTLSVGTAVMGLWLARLLARTLSAGQLVPVVAWKLLRSQTLVPTFGTRLNRNRRILLEPRTGSWSLWSGVLLPLAVAAVGTVPSVLYWNQPVSDLVGLLATGGVPALALAFCSFRSVKAQGLWSAFVYGLVALALGFLVVRSVALLDISLTFTTFIASGLLALVAAIVLVRLVLRVVLWARRKSGSLPEELNPAYSERPVYRLAEGVGPSVFVSLVGVAVGVWALILVLSVMSGFSGEITERIIRAKDHILVKTEHGQPLAAPHKLAEEIRTIPGVVSAAPYVEGEAMMSSPINISPTVSIRGIDPDGRGVDFLRPLIVSGGIHFLAHPEELGATQGISGMLEMPPEWEPVRKGDEPATELDAEGLHPSGRLDRPSEVAPGLEAMPDIDDSDGSPVAREPRQAAPGLEAMPDIDDSDGSDSGSTARQASNGPSDARDDSRSDARDRLDAIAATEEAFAAAARSPTPLLPSVIIGQALSESLQVAVGGRLQIISPDGDIGPMGVQPRARPYRVAAVFESGMHEYDLKVAFVLLPEAQRFFNLGSAVDRLDVRLDDLGEAQAVAEQIRTLPSFPGSEAATVLTWEEMNRNLFSALKLEQLVMFVVLGFIIVIAAFNIVASLVIVIRRRLSSIAILLSMGTRVKQIKSIFFVIGLSAGVLGALSGVILGLLSCAFVESVGLVLPREYYVREVPVDVVAWKVVAVAVAAVAIAALASWYPGRIASRVTIVEGLKDER